MRTFKTTRKLSGGQKKYRKWEDWKEGDIAVGNYLSIHKDQYGKECPVIEVLEAMFKDKTGKEYNGSSLVLNACGMLTKALEGVEFGTTIQVEYQGTAVIEKGKYAGKNAHVVAVEVVEEDLGEVEL